MEKIIEKLNDFQQRHPLPGFIFAVIKKYGDDEAGRQAALLTYYAFLSLFPLILVLTTLTELIPVSHTAIQNSIIKGTTNYFPVLGNQLSTHIHTLHKSGFALAIGLLFTFYGARGVADAFQRSIQDLWEVPRSRRAGFPQSMLKSLNIILITGVGFVIASVSIGWASTANQGWLVRALTMLINLLVWYVLFILLITISLPRRVPSSETRAAAITAAVGLVIVQTLGGYLLRRELKNLDALYSYFALALGLLFWIYLQVQVLFYALEIAAVKSQALWPRSLTGKKLTAADRRLASELADT
ncbi:MAG TPA: YihY/virulence factor BrkB family protein [Candidatus Saccharimonadales bacterium]|nr:YihY/virulence factor BrkB family protein [Candidatus Saccharimonadales bacterium]